MLAVPIEGGYKPATSDLISPGVWAIVVFAVAAASSLFGIWMIARWLYRRRRDDKSQT